MKCMWYLKPSPEIMRVGPHTLICNNSKGLKAIKMEGRKKFWCKFPNWQCLYEIVLSTFLSYIGVVSRIYAHK